MAYGRSKYRKSYRSYKKRYNKYASRRKYGRFGSRYMRNRRSKLYRRAGNFAMSIAGAKPEAKSFDSYPTNWQPTAGGWVTAATLNTLWAATTVPGYMLTATTGTDLTATSGNGTLVLNAIPIGQDIFQRVGRMVMMKSIMFKAGFLGPAAVTPGATISIGAASSAMCGDFRILIVCDRQFNAAIPDKSSILAPLGSSGVNQAAGSGTYVSCQSNYNLANRGRYLVLHDKTYRVDNTFNRVVSVKVFKRLNLKTVFNDAASGNASIMTGALLLLAVSDMVAPSAAAAPSPSTITCPFAIFPNCRIRFMDP